MDRWTTETMHYLGAEIVVDWTSFTVYWNGRLIGRFQSIASARAQVRYLRRLERAILSATRETAASV